MSLKWSFKCFFMKCVNQGLKVRLYPDEDMMIKINQNIGNSRFTWNKLLEYYQKTYKLFKFHGYSKLKCNMTTFNTMLNMLKKEHDFLYLSESSSLQQVYRDLYMLIISFSMVKVIIQDLNPKNMIKNHSEYKTMAI